MEVKKIKNIVGSLFVLSLFSICFHTFLIIIGSKVRSKATGQRSNIERSKVKQRLKIRVGCRVRIRVRVGVSL